MGYPPLEDLLPRSNYSIYKLVRMASNRATELADGKSKLIAEPSMDKATTVALEEIQAGKVVLDEVAEKAPAPQKKQQEESAPVKQEAENA